MMQGYSTAKDVRARSKDVREHCSEQLVQYMIDSIRDGWQPLDRKTREKLRQELLEQAQYMKRKAYQTLDQSEIKPNEVKEMLNTILKINNQIAELAEISTGSRKDGGDTINITHTDSRTQTINVNSWTEDDLENAKKILELQKALPKTEKVINA